MKLSFDAKLKAVGAEDFNHTEKFLKIGGNYLFKQNMSFQIFPKRYWLLKNFNRPSKWKFQKQQELHQIKKI